MGRGSCDVLPVDPKLTIPTFSPKKSFSFLILLCLLNVAGVLKQSNSTPFFIM